MKGKKKHSPVIAEGEGQEREIGNGYTFQFHNDKRPTVVEIDKKIYNLVLSDSTLEMIKGLDIPNRPHVRHLNPIPQRSPSAQEAHNNDSREMFELCKQVPKGRGDKITSIKKAAALGANVPEAVKKLMEEKEKATKEGDEKKARLIRRQLRALDYKRYLEKE